jgi:hypothetical protein
MSVPCKFERSILSHDEYETIRPTHHPTIYEVEPAELEAIRSRLRKMRDKEQTLSRQKRREARGKSGRRGSKLSWNRRAALTTQTGLRRGAEAGEQGARASS